MLQPDLGEYRLGTGLIGIHQVRHRREMMLAGKFHHLAGPATRLPGDTVEIGLTLEFIGLVLSPGDNQRTAGFW